MLHSKYKPMFYSSERLTALAKIVSETSVDNIPISSNSLKPTPYNPYQSRTTPINELVCSTENPQHLQIEHEISETNTLNFISDNKNNNDKIVPNIVSLNTDSNMSVQDNINSQDSYSQKTIMFTVISAGFNHGNFSEFKLDENVFIPKNDSKRGITVLYLVNDLKKNYFCNFDFYTALNKVATNINFISLIRRLPEDTYFAMSIKDDAYMNLFEGTKYFLSTIIGCKKIWRLNYRNSWCAIIYKKTEKSFEVISESHNPNGIAVAKCSIVNKSFEPKQNYNYVSSTNYQNSNSNNKEEIVCDKINTNDPSVNKKKDSSSETIKNEKYNKLFEELQSLKTLSLEQTKIINKLIENEKINRT